MSKPTLILSIDGGGIRGIIPTTILTKLEADLKRPLYDTFDMFAGTSVGSWLVLAISALQMPASQILELFNAENVKQIFDRRFLSYLGNGPKYKGNGKRAVLDKLFSTKRFLDIKKQTLITAYDIISNKAVVFKCIGKSSDAAYNPLIAEVADASSAAPTYFPTIQSTDKIPRWFADGGIADNDPALCILTDALHQKIPLDHIKILSLGTGMANPNRVDPIAYGKSSENWGAIGWLRHGIIDDFFDGDTSVTEYQTQQLLQDNYYRIDAIIPKEQQAMDNTDPNNITSLQAIGEQWYAENREKLLTWLA